MEDFNLKSVREAKTPGDYIVLVELLDDDNEPQEFYFLSSATDTNGLAPQIRPAVMQWIADGETVLPYIPSPEPVPQEVSRRQFYQGLAVAQFITKQEALDAIRMTSLPAAIQAMVDGMEDDDAKFEASSLLYGATSFYRDHPLVMVFAIAQEMSDEDVDDFWRLCSAL